MYKEFFGLNDMPFSIAPNPRYLYMSEGHREALAHLFYGIKGEGGFVLLTGEVGTGKTTVCRCLIEQIPKETEIAFILNPKVTVEDLLATICDEFGIKYPAGNKNNKYFIDAINTYLLESHAQGRNTVLIIEEAQNLSIDVLEQLRLLTNLETSQRKLLQIILIGQPELRDLLARPELRQLSQRITARYHLGPLFGKEIESYVSHRLAVAGTHSILFPASTVSKIAEISHGIPRLINLLCDRALLGAFVQGKEKVDRKTLATAAREVFSDTKDRLNFRKGYRWLFAGVLLLACVSLLVNYSQNPPIYGAIKTAESLPKKNIPAPPDQSASSPFFSTEIQASAAGGESAHQDLFRQWHIEYKEGAASVCQQAQTQGLYCMQRRGDLNSLRNLNRPAVLRLTGEGGQEFYATIVALSDRTAKLIAGTETRELVTRDLASRWTGDYTVLLRMPQKNNGGIRPGDRGPAVTWLESQLALIQGRVPRSDSVVVFDGDLVKQVKAFQFAEGLKADGIVGHQTMIHLNAAAVSMDPVLH